jgi:polyisoprenoid-binding protein YceI
VSFDPENPGATTGKIIVAANTMHVGNPTMKEHLHSEMWMNVAKFPEIIYELSSLKNVKTEGNVTTAEATGKITVKGVTKEMTVPVKLTYLKDKLQQRVPGKKGDLLVVRSNFGIKRADFGINSGKGEDKVSNEVELSLSVAGLRHDEGAAGQASRPPPLVAPALYRSSLAQLSRGTIRQASALQRFVEYAWI